MLGQEKLGSPETRLDVVRRPAIRLVRDTLVLLGPQHSWLLVTSHLLFLRSREKIPEASFQPVTALMGICFSRSYPALLKSCPHLWTQPSVHPHVRVPQSLRTRISLTQGDPRGTELTEPIKWPVVFTLP